MKPVELQRTYSAGMTNLGLFQYPQNSPAITSNGFYPIRCRKKWPTLSSREKNQSPCVRDSPQPRFGSFIRPAELFFRLSVFLLPGLWEKLKLQPTNS